MQQLSLTELREHPLNKKIYFTLNDEDNDLVESIKEHGILVPITLNPDRVILSGHRRYKAACQLGMSHVPVQYKNTLNADQELEFLILSNKYRTKTVEEKIRETQQLKDVLIRKGMTKRDALGEASDMSGRTYSKAEKVVDEIDAIRESDPDRARRLSEKLNKSVDGAYRELTEDDELETELEEIEEEMKDSKKYFYLDDLLRVTTALDNAYLKLAAKRNSQTPISVGAMIGNLSEIRERLLTWIPKRMKDCDQCGGTGQIKTQCADGDGTVVSCKVCLDGKVGLFRPSTK